MGLNLYDIQCMYQWKLSDFIMLPEIVQQLGHVSCDIRIMAIVMVFVELRHILPTDGGMLVDTKFANARKPVWLDNRKDEQR